MAKILVIDDEKNTRLLYRRELTDDGYEVTTASNAREALERFRSYRPDVVILDIRMPGMDGLEVLARLLAIDRKLPILLNSAYPVYRDNFLCWAADDFIVKSSDLTELKCAIKNRLVRPATAGTRVELPPAAESTSPAGDASLHDMKVSAALIAL